MELLKTIVEELNETIKKTESNANDTARIHALTELLKVLTYNCIINNKVRFNFETIDKVID